MLRIFCLCFMELSKESAESNWMHYETTELLRNADLSQEVPLQIKNQNPSHEGNANFQQVFPNDSLRRGALTLGMPPDAQSRCVPHPPHTEKQTTGPQTTKLASLLSKHRRHLVGKAPARPSPAGVFEVTMAALSATKRQRDRELQEQDINKCSKRGH